MKRLLALVLVMAYALVTWASVSVTVNGTSYTIPQTNERGWGNSVTAWIQAMSQYSLQPTGGTFALTNDVNFGANYGLKSRYFSTRDANPSTAGLLRLTKSDSIGFRNNANDGNLLLAIDSSDRLTFGGVILPSATTGSFQDSTFNLYDNSDATKKIAFEASGITTGTTRTVTMPDADVNLGALTNSNIDASAAISYSKLNLTGSVVNADIGVGASIELSKLDPLSNSIVPVTNGSGILTSSTVTATTLGYLDATSSVQTQLDAKVAKSTLTTKGDIYVATGSAAVSRLSVGTNNQVLTADSAQSAGVKWADPPSNPATTKGDLSGYDSAPARVPVGADGQALLANSASSTGLTWSAFLPPSQQAFTSGSGTYSLNYAFLISTGSATAGATYTHNSVTYTVSRTVSSGTLLIAYGSSAPLASGTLTKASGTGDSSLTFSQIRVPVYLRVRMVGGGGGGAGSGTSGVYGGAGGTGGTTTFGSSLLSSSGGVGGSAGSGNGGAGGTATISLPAYGSAFNGGVGGSGAGSQANAFIPSGAGASTPFGGGGLSSVTASARGPAANSGGGGGGASNAGNSTAQPGGGGGAGAFIDAIIPGPLSASYAYAIGAAGTAGAAGTSGYVGAAGSAGYIEVTEYYQ